MSIEKNSSRADTLFARSRRQSKMAKLLSPLLAAAMLSGCAHHYDMTLTNGIRLTNVTKPVLDREAGVYNYKDLSGVARHVSAGRVVEIAPHSDKNTVPGTMQSKTFQ